MRRPFVIVAILCACLIGSGVALVAGVIPNTDGMIYACYSKTTRALYVLDYPAKRCGSQYTMISWPSSVAVLTARVTTLEARVAALEATATPTQSPVPPSPTPSPSPTPTSTPTLSPSPTPTLTPTPIPTPTPTPFTTIQAAVNAAPAGSVVIVPPGVYREKVTVEKPLTIKGYGATVVGDLTKAEEWFLVFSDDVTIEGFTMHTSGTTKSQDGAIQLGGYWYAGHAFNRLTIRNCKLYGTLTGSSVGNVISIQDGGVGHLIEGNIIANAGNNGIGWGGGTGGIIRNNRFTGNTTNPNADVGWEGAALKVFTSDLTFEGNEVDHNLGRGFWSDTLSSDLVIRNNRIHDNAYNGLFIESSHRVTVTGNVVWNNATTPASRSWLWGGGIAVASSEYVSISGNLVAWNGQGITVVSQSRGDFGRVIGVSIFNNDIIMSRDDYAHAWAQDWDGGLFDPASANGGYGNRYWGGRFAWNGDIATLAAFNLTPAEEGGRYLSLVERDAVLAAAGILP